MTSDDLVHEPTGLPMTTRVTDTITSVSGLRRIYPQPTEAARDTMPNGAVNASRRA